MKKFYLIFFVLLLAYVNCNAYESRVISARITNNLAGGPYCLEIENYDLGGFETTRRILPLWWRSDDSYEQNISELKYFFGDINEGAFLATNYVSSDVLLDDDIFKLSHLYYFEYDSQDNINYFMIDYFDYSFKISDDLISRTETLHSYGLAPAHYAPDGEVVEKLMHSEISSEFHEDSVTVIFKNKKFTYRIEIDYED